MGAINVLVPLLLLIVGVIGCAVLLHFAFDWLAGLHRPGGKEPPKPPPPPTGQESVPTPPVGRSHG